MMTFGFAPVELMCSGIWACGNDVASSVLSSGVPAMGDGGRLIQDRIALPAVPLSQEWLRGRCRTRSRPLHQRMLMSADTDLMKVDVDCRIDQTRHHNFPILVVRYVSVQTERWWQEIRVTPFPKVDACAEKKGAGPAITGASSPLAKIRPVEEPKGAYRSDCKPPGSAGGCGYWLASESSSGTGVQESSGLNISILLNSSRLLGPRSFW